MQYKNVQQFHNNRHNVDIDMSDFGSSSFSLNGAQLLNSFFLYQFLNDLKCF